MIHISRDGQQFGPYTVEDAQTHLASGALLATDQAWYEGAPDWMPLDQVPGVASATVVGAAAAAPARGKGKKEVALGTVAAVLLIAAGVTFGLGLFSSDEKKQDKSANGKKLEPKGGEGNSASGKKPEPKGGGRVFANTAGPVFERNRCFECHHTDKSGKAKADLDFANPKSLKGFVLPNEPGNFATAPIVLVLTPGAVEPMPPKGPAVSAADVEIIKAWIAAGAKF